MMKLKANKPFSKTLLTSAIAMSLSGVAVAADYPVTEFSDDGTGLIADTLSWAIKQANTNPGTDTISLHTDVMLFGVMKRLIDSDVTIQSDGPRRTINGYGKRPFFIKSGDVTIQSIDVTNSSATGGASEAGGQGAGMGGAVFIYDGNVTISDVTIGNSSALGGIQAYASAYSQGGGGLFGNAGTQSGGGLFASGSGNTGGYGGYGAYQTTAPDFGAGGDYTGNIPGEHGGFGGGGGFPSGHGGFGGGGASTLSNQTAGNGGFGAGAPYAGSYGVYSGFPGYGATMNGAAGMGGAIFVRTGQLHITDSDLSNNVAIGSADAKGLGGAIFVLHATDNSNNGTPASQQGMPAQLPTVTGCGNAFTNNSAPGSTGQPDNDHDVFDLAGVAEDLTQPCPMEQNLVVTVATDNGLGDVPNTLSWAIKESNAIPGDDTITLATDVTITGVMKRLIDSNITIQSDGTRRTIDGSSQFRPLFIKSGQVNLSGFDVSNGLAQGGEGYTGGAGMGGGLFIYAGDVAINDLSFSNSTASGGVINVTSKGGGGMFGDGDDGGGGLFASASGSTGGHGGFYGDFGRGGNASSSGANGHFGGGGGDAQFPTVLGGYGGFGGGSGFGTFEGYGGFGGGSSRNPGFGATEHGAGMGGALFIRSGQVTITNTEFNDNQALATGGASGLGGGVFIVHTSTNDSASQQGMPNTLATVTGCDNSFTNNTAMNDAGTHNNNDDLFDAGGRTHIVPLDFPCSGPLQLTVTKPYDDGTGNIPNTLSWAILVSNAIPGDDTIALATDVVLTAPASGNDIKGYTGTPTITGKINLLGHSHVLERDLLLLCDINNSVDLDEFRLLHVGYDGELAINNLHLFNGCVDSSSYPAGGAILNQGDLQVHSVTFIDNRAQLGGGISSQSPNENMVIIQNSTFSGNSAEGFPGSSHGGAISNENHIQLISNNTFFHNSASGNAGGIESYEGNIALISNNLFVGNSGNFADCVLSAGGTAQGSNNISDQVNDGCGVVDDFSLSAGTIGILQDNGCAVPNVHGRCVATHALTLNSEAIDAGDANATPVDQRGFLADGPRDLGAFEYGASLSDVIFVGNFD